MNKYFVISVYLIFITGIAGCKKHSTLPKVSAPNWTVDSTGQYPASMTAVVQVSENLQPYIHQTDKIGAFVGDECRGLGTLVSTGSVSAFFILIHGTASEQSKISFRYYTSRKSNMYTTTSFLEFIVDGNYGTADGPRMLDLSSVK